MRIRYPFAGGFAFLLLLSGYGGLSSVQVGSIANDKALHLVTFFLLTAIFYWILDTNRRRILNITLIVCTLCGGVGSEFLQVFIPNGREFDLYDIVANVIGSLAALGLCSWYHKRMLERKRSRKHYNAVPGEAEADVELGEGGLGGGLDGEHEEGVVIGGSPGETALGTEVASRSLSLEQEVDSWDENAVDDWDENDLGDVGGSTAGTSKGKDAENGDLADSNKRVD